MISFYVKWKLKLWWNWIWYKHIPDFKSYVPYPRSTSLKKIFVHQVQDEILKMIENIWQMVSFLKQSISNQKKILYNVQYMNSHMSFCSECPQICLWITFWCQWNNAILNCDVIDLSIGEELSTVVTPQGNKSKRITLTYRILSTILSAWIKKVWKNEILILGKSESE